MKLIDAPVGMFEYNGTLALKTEYSTQHKDGTITPDCYIVESGEYFWGGTSDVETRNNLEVTPVEVEVVRHGRWYLAEDAVFRCSECGRICYELDAPYCYCGALMDGEDEHEIR